MLPKRKRINEVAFNSCPTNLLRKDQFEHCQDYSDSTDVVSSSDEEDRWREAKPNVNDLPSEYWAIQKLFRYVKVGNETATMVSLSCLRDYDLTKQIHQMAIRDTGGLDILVNLLQGEDDRCCLCALHILHVISANIDIRKYIVDLNVVPSLVKILRQPAINLKIPASNVIANVAKVRSARKEFRALHAVQILVDLMDIPNEVVRKPLKKQDENERELMELARVTANALTALTLSSHNRQIASKYGLVQIIGKLLTVRHDDVAIAVLALCERCFTEVCFQLGISTEKMMPNIIKHLKSDNDQVKVRCCFALMTCAVDRGIQRLIWQAGGLKHLVDVLEYAVTKNNLIELKEATSGAIWKCAELNANVNDLSKLSTMGTLTELMQNEKNIDVLVNVVGALAQLLQLDGNRKVFGQGKALNVLVNFLNSSNYQLLRNACKALEQFGQEEKGAKEMEKLDAVRLLWSLLRHPKQTVQADAARALSSYISSSTESGPIIRSFVGAFEIIIELLQSKNEHVQAAVCGTVSKICKDPNNLAILTDYGAIPLLAKLVQTRDDRLRENLAAAIASCAPHGNNTQLFGQLRTVSVLVGYLAATDRLVHRTTAMALEMLSADVENCLTMHQCGAPPFLLELIGSNDKILQTAASMCLQNIRNLALKAEKYAVTTIIKTK